MDKWKDSKAHLFTITEIQEAKETPPQLVNIQNENARPSYQQGQTKMHADRTIFQLA